MTTESGEGRLRAAIRRVRALPTETPHRRLLKLCLHLSQQELAAVVFEIGGDYDALLGDTLADKARALIVATRRHGGECWLLQAVRRHRPDLTETLDALARVFC